MIDQQHQAMFQDVWDNGNYRMGSTAQRLVRRILNLIPADATINDYGSGTGRAEVEILHARPKQKINMFDIAENALEPAARALVNRNNGVTFTHADLSDLSGIPHAKWGMCINVLMTVQPEKLDTILGEIRRTCDNLFFEAYDFEDMRLGRQMTTVKMNGEAWKAKLSQFWPDVQFERSPESARRYIFVCRSSNSSPLRGEGKGEGEINAKKITIQTLRNKYAGQTCYIVGRGASLLQVKKEHFSLGGPVIVINEAIINIAKLWLKNDIYSQWRNGDLIADLRAYLRPGNALLLSEDPVPQYVSTAEQFSDYKPAYWFECRRDLGCDPRMAFSHYAAIEIATKIFGCNKLIMMGFDSYRGDDRTVLKEGFVQSEYRPGDYRDQIDIICARLREMPKISAKWFFPEEKAKGVIRINIGCGEVPLQGYINIDLHHNAADVKMDALNLALADNSVDEIYSSHLIEHFPKRDVPKALKEWFRVLKNGGTLSMNLPNLEWCMRNWLGQPEEKRFGLYLDMIYGLQTNDGEYHKTGFTKYKLNTLLKEAGFSDITITDHWSHAQSCYQVDCTKRTKVTVITLTGDRPEAFALCRRWMENQTRQPDQWIVLSDGKVPLKNIPPGCHYVRREPKPTDPRHTMIINLREAIKHIEGSVVFIMEDDEYYGPKYIETLLKHLDKYEVVGVGRSKYYHLPSGSYIKDCNMDNASLAQMAFRRSFLPEFEALLEGDQYVDMRIWKHVGNTNHLRWVDSDKSPDRIVNGRGYVFDDGDEHIYVGMKGLPGREGICWGHKEDPRYSHMDAKREIIKKWLGNDYQYYSDLINKLTRH